MLVVLPSFKTLHSTGKQPGSKLTVATLYHLLTAEFLELFNRSLKEEFPVLVAIAAILLNPGSIHISPSPLRIFANRHATALTELTLSHNLSLGCSDEFLSHSEE
jgi:hypothetical protein